MVDPAAAQAVVRQLNRWYRKRAKPRGIIDHYHRGIRMNHTAVYRAVMESLACLLLAIAITLYFRPAVMEDKSTMMVLLLRSGWMALLIFPAWMLLKAFREHVIVADDGLIKTDVFGRQTRLSWKDVRQFQIKADDNNVIFKDNSRARMKLSLSYDGWQDFLDMAARRMDPALYWQFNYALANVDSAAPPSWPKKGRWTKWFSSRKSS